MSQQLSQTCDLYVHHITSERDVEQRYSHSRAHTHACVWIPTPRPCSSRFVSVQAHVPTCLHACVLAMTENWLLQDHATRIQHSQMKDSASVSFFVRAVLPALVFLAKCNQKARLRPSKQHTQINKTKTTCSKTKVPLCPSVHPLQLGAQVRLSAWNAPKARSTFWCAGGSTRSKPGPCQPTGSNDEYQ